MIAFATLLDLIPQNHSFHSAVYFNALTVMYVSNMARVGQSLVENVSSSSKNQAPTLDV
jgi:hypothetical protein